MLKNLQFNVTFNSTGKTFEGDHNFSNGMTAITGPNESGKSLIVEMLRYGLFGTKGLRASVSSYDKLSVAVEFFIKDKTYIIKRNKSGMDTLSLGLEVIVSGTKPVNAAIEKLFGYNLDVFDISNACLQGEVESLSDKTPADRKRMVDKVIGLDIIDKIIKTYSEEASLTKRDIETLKSTLVELTKPVMVGEYIEESNGASQIAILEQSCRSLVEKTTWIESAKVDKPEAVEKTMGLSLETLMEVQEDFKSLNAKQTQLEYEMKQLPKQSPKTNELSYEDRLSAAIAYDKYIANEDTYPKPTITKEEIMQQEGLILNKEKVRKIKALQDRIDTLKSNNIDCPKCSHSFALEHNLVNQLEAEIEELGEVFKVYIEPEKSTSQLNDYTREWDHYDTKPDVPKAEPTGECSAAVEVEHLRYQEYQKYLTLKLVYDDIKLPEDPSQLILDKQREEAEAKAFKINLENYNIYTTKKVIIKQEIKELTGCEDQLTTLRLVTSNSRMHDQAVKNYDEASTIMIKRRVEINSLEEGLKTTENIKKGLKDLKPRVKMFLVPSLNKVASSLISQMTKGERTNIQIDEQFNIKVDGQAIEELSGSGKSVANLAIRIGLGTVLTNKVFSVFLADEIDAAMDKDRAAFTSECLRNLNDTIKQIVIVSHQQPEADYYITLRK